MRPRLDRICSVEVSNTLEGIGKVSASGFSDASFKLGWRVSDNAIRYKRFGVVFDDFQVSGCDLPITACVKDVRKQKVGAVDKVKLRGRGLPSVDLFGKLVATSLAFWSSKNFCPG